MSCHSPGRGPRRIPAERIERPTARKMWSLDSVLWAVWVLAQAFWPFRHSVPPRVSYQTLVATRAPLTTPSHHLARAPRASHRCLVRLVCSSARRLVSATRNGPSGRSTLPACCPACSLARLFENGGLPLLCGTPSTATPQVRLLCSTWKKSFPVRKASCSTFLGPGSGCCSRPCLINAPMSCLDC